MFLFIHSSIYLPRKQKLSVNNGVLHKGTKTRSGSVWSRSRACSSDPDQGAVEVGEAPKSTLYWMQIQGPWWSTLLFSSLAQGQTYISKMIQHIKITDLAVHYDPKDMSICPVTNLLIPLQAQTSKNFMVGLS